MKKFMFIMHAEGPVDMSGENGEAMMKWYEKNAESFIDSGNPFDPKSEAHIKNGEVSMDADSTAGYSIVKAADLHAAVTIAMSHPMAKIPGCWVDVHETMPM